jgi:hypothetical protein
MKTTITKQGRAWEWSIDRNAEHLAGGYCKTKADAENDSRLVAKGIEKGEARNAGRIAEGDEVRIKPEWQDEGDDGFVFIAIESQLEGMNYVRCRAIRKATGEPGIGIQEIKIEHMDR